MYTGYCRLYIGAHNQKKLEYFGIHSAARKKMMKCFRMYPARRTRLNNWGQNFLCSFFRELERFLGIKNEENKF